MEYKAGMFVYALAFCLGVVLVQQLAALPEISTLTFLLSFVSLCIVTYVYVCNESSFVLNKEITLRGVNMSSVITNTADSVLFSLASSNILIDNINFSMTAAKTIFYASSEFVSI